MTQLTIAQQRSAARWYPLTPHDVQRRLVSDPHRFKVVAAGRRSGKSEIGKRKIVREAMMNPGMPYLVSAPTREQTKRIFWDDLKLLSFACLHDTKPRETDLIISFPHGASINLIGLDEPDRVEGSPWAGALIDESASMKAKVWYENIRPALDTQDPSRPADFRSWAWLIGVPEQRNHFYDLYEYARSSGDPDWAAYHWLSSLILPEAVIASAKASLSARQFRQEYEASFETASGQIYPDYCDENLCTDVAGPTETLYWAHDFNYSPLSSVICVVREGYLIAVDEIVLEGATADMAAMEFVDRYRGHQNKVLRLYGDASGRAGEKHGLSSNYRVIEAVLRDHGWRVVRLVKNAAPAIRDRQNAVRAMICAADGTRRLFVNKQRAGTMDHGLRNTQFKKGSGGRSGSGFLEEDSYSQHITTALGYLIDYQFPLPGTTPVGLIHEGIRG